MEHARDPGDFEGEVEDSIFLNFPGDGEGEGEGEDVEDSRADGPQEGGAAQAGQVLLQVLFKYFPSRSSTSARSATSTSATPASGLSNIEKIGLLI